MKGKREGFFILPNDLTRLIQKLQQLTHKSSKLIKTNFQQVKTADDAIILTEFRSAKNGALFSRFLQVLMQGDFHGGDNFWAQKFNISILCPALAALAETTALGVLTIFNSDELWEALKYNCWVGSLQA